MKNKNWARETAVKVLHKVLREDAYSNIALRQELQNTDLSRLDKALVTEIVNGTVKNLIRIDWIMEQFVKTNKKRINPWIEDIIRCGIYQIMFLERVPDSAVCNESAELARRFGHEGTVKFVNGVLRNISRSKEAVSYPDRVKNPVKFLSVYYSHPSWIVERFIRDYGYEFTEGILKSNNETPPFTIRVNTLKTDKEKLKSMLTNEGIEFEDGKYNYEALRIRGTSSLEDRESFKAGLFQVQDESSMLTARILAPRPGELVLDVCSAPGGKTTHMAELMKNKGKIIARDIHDHKLKLIQESCVRLGIDIVTTELYDAKKLDKSLVGKLDKVLLDAPCSGLGVIRRKPDLRYKKQPDNFVELAELQLLMLKNAAAYLRNGGELVYSTCTINKEENINVIQRFLDDNKEYYTVSIRDSLPEGLVNEASEKGYIELYPNINETDGFFIAKIKRR
ncbi:MAG: 16S rRNA (cytosine(967)-C(5))-methyltransferase RsmB [Bacillota bacterium]